jgi:hypothetical protein
MVRASRSRRPMPAASDRVWSSPNMRMSATPAEGARSPSRSPRAACWLSSGQHRLRWRLPQSRFYAEHGLVAIGTSATGDATTNATTFFGRHTARARPGNRSPVTLSTHLAILARAFCSRMTVTANPCRLETGRRAARHNDEIRVVHENGGDRRLGVLGRR